MKTATGIFATRSGAERALQQLGNVGFSHGEVSMLAPDKPGNGGDSVVTTEGEQPGIGKAIGGVVGTAIGASGGLPLGGCAIFSPVSRHRAGISCWFYYCCNHWGGRRGWRCGGRWRFGKCAD